VLKILTTVANSDQTIFYLLSATALKTVKRCCHLFGMLLPVRACWSPTSCGLFEHVAAGQVPACSSMLEPDMLLPVQACCSRTGCPLFEHVAAGHVAACSSMLQPDMLPPVQAGCSWTWCGLFEHFVVCGDSVSNF
jgi:hypothetical protein